ncbi:MAG: hypothetical protein ACYTF7_07035 [Planctomycetota bacterium]|jgi:hypothetical protein
MAVSKQTFSTVRGILEQLDNRISEARERRTGNPSTQATGASSHRQFGKVGDDSHGDQSSSHPQS